jgi:hypothetical protein
MTRLQRILNAIVKKPLLFTCLVAVLLQFILLFLGLGNVHPQFPLDDAWIHQTYARNLAEYGSWSFVPGVVSGGSTSPLWTLLLAPGFLFKGDFYFYWTLFLSTILLAGLVFFLCKSYQTISKGSKAGAVMLLGLLVGFEWHLQWATASGMETIAYTFVIVMITYLTLQESPKWWLIGATCGLLVWIRPDGLTILGPIFFAILTKLLRKQFNSKRFIQLLAPIIVLIAGYCFFNYVTTSQCFPNTFYAKQMEYRELLETPLFTRVFNEFSPLWVGVCVLLLPGFAFNFLVSAVRKNLTVLGYCLWVIGYIVLFAVRLPVVYQHGRYIIPVIPLFILIGFLGTEELIYRIRQIRPQNFTRLAIWGSMLALSAAFYVRGIQAYSTDLIVIDTFMVRPAHWVAQNTPTDTVIAVHDIGAMGFFGQRSLVDLAGLVNPEVIPFIRDDVKIREYIVVSGADYFVCFNDWYANSSGWGEEVAFFNMIVDENTKEVDIIKLDK